MIHPEWLDDERRQVQETVTWIISPTCRCRWREDDRDPTEKIHAFILDQRDRDCPMHGERGVC
jgi:hypothetical protein